MRWQEQRLCELFTKLFTFLELTLALADIAPNHPLTQMQAGGFFYKPINHESNLIFTVQLIELLFKPRFLRKKKKTV